MKKRLVFLGLLITSLAVNAQTATTNTGILYITGNTDIFYAGSDFTNTSTLLTNNGQLYVKGNLTNNQTPATIGTGTLYLNGSSAQSVAGSAPFKTYHFNTDNAAGITLNNNLSVSGTHTFVTGNIASSVTPNYLIYEPGAAHIGSSDAAHVTGWVKKLGTTAFTFPTGNANYLREIAISNLSASMEFNATYSGATIFTTNIQSPLSSINPGEYWTLNNITAGATTAQVTLNWDNSKIAFPDYVVPDIRSAQYTSGNWTSTGGSATGSTATTGSITSLALNVMGAMSIGSETFIVPLDFLNITAERKKEYTVVEWITANEANVKHHEVQRSLGNNFTTIGSVPARNTIAKQTYNFNDADNLSGMVYYRIKSVDLDGKTKYSKVVSVFYDGLSESIILKNNPVKGTIRLSLTSAKNTMYHYQLVAANGSVVQQGNIPYSGTRSLVIPVLSSITKGSYILLMTDGKNSLAKKIIVE